MAKVDFKTILLPQNRGILLDIEIFLSQAGIPPSLPDLAGSCLAF
jgi:hypothetical protein